MDPEIPSTSKEAKDLEWTEADEEWLKQVPSEHHITARRYGKWLFSMVMLTGANNYGLGVIASMLRGNRKGTQALGVLANTMNQLIGLALASKGFTQADFESCKEDIERVAVLMQGGAKPGDKKTAGGILLVN